MQYTLKAQVVLLCKGFRDTNNLITDIFFKAIEKFK